MKRVLVTGGAGFIGSHTVDLLLQQGLDVVVYDNLSTGSLGNLNLSHPNLTFIHADILEYEILREHILESDAVLHLAALSSVPKSIEDPIQSLNINTLGFLHVLQAIRELKRKVRFVYASSAAVYGDTNQLPCRDDFNPDVALSPYALDKANNERYANLFLNLFGISSLGLRYFNVYGPRQDPSSPYSGVISKFVNCCQQNAPITIYGNGKQSRDFIYVEDVARANYLALQSDYCGILNIATGVPETLLNLLGYLEDIEGKQITVTFAKARDGDIAHSYATVEKAYEQLEFRASRGLADGMRLLLNNVRI